MIVMDGLDPAVIGYVDEPVYRVVYDYEKLVETLVAQFAQDAPAPPEELRDQAVEWISFNIARGVPYQGKGAPLVMYPADRAMIDEIADNAED